jgi:ElaB/YqjD/DUF883 family membrane-anchored ribosome-binding protein
MSQYPHERDPGSLAEQPATIVVTDIDDRTEVYAAAEASTTGRPSYAPDADDRGDDGKVAQVKDSATEAGQHVADVAKDQASNVAAETKSQAKDLLGQGREELRQQTAQQQDRVASGLHSLSRELDSMASSSSEQGLATDLAREASDRTRTIATWLESREPGQLLDEVRSFARERPGAFLGIAAAAGIVVGRLGRGLKDGEPQQARHLADPKGQPTDPIVGQYS